MLAPDQERESKIPREVGGITEDIQGEIPKIGSLERGKRWNVGVLKVNFMDFEPKDITKKEQDILRSIHQDIEKMQKAIREITDKYGDDKYENSNAIQDVITYLDCIDDNLENAASDLVYFLPEEHEALEKLLKVEEQNRKCDELKRKKEDEERKKVMEGFDPNFMR
jgi:hypothetical protein